jgi:hypothetical protein
MDYRISNRSTERPGSDPRHGFRVRDQSKGFSTIWEACNPVQAEPAGSPKVSDEFERAFSTSGSRIKTMRPACEGYRNRTCILRNRLLSSLYLIKRARVNAAAEARPPMTAVCNPPRSGEIPVSRPFTNPKMNSAISVTTTESLKAGSSSPIVI